MYRMLTCALVAFCVCAGSVAAGAQSDAGEKPAVVPLTMTYFSRYGTYAPQIDLRVGALQRLPVTFDTGSTGLRLFAVPGIGSPSSGTHCSQTPTSVTYGDPAYITYSGVVCYGRLHFGGITTPREVPFALLTSASCPQTNPGCTIITPQQNYKNGTYGVFGAGLALGDVLPNPLRMLPGTYGERFALRLTRARGDVILGGPPFPGTPYPLVSQGFGAFGLAGYHSGAECVVVNGVATAVCPEVVYDTGNGIPFFYAEIPQLPITEGFVAPGTHVGLASPCGGPATTNVVAGNSYATEFRVDPLENRIPLINIGILGFFGNEVGFDAGRTFECGPGVMAQGVMTIAPLTASAR